MGRKRQYPGLWNRNGTWWIEKTIRVGGKVSELRESTGQSCFEVAVQVYLKRVTEESERLLFSMRPAYTVGQAAAEFLAMNNAQNTTVLLGKILRIDVDGGTPYAIPPDNPFASGAGGNRREIYAWGLRNPWRFSFDRDTGELWAGDVGQNAFEEIDRIERGGNYGWNIREGKHCFQTAGCSTTGLIDPVVDYRRNDGASVTGGYVYRGAAIPRLRGVYLYGDFISGKVWGLFPSNRSAPRLQLESGRNIASFAEGVDGELYVVSFADGKIYRILPK